MNNQSLVEILLEKIAERKSQICFWREMDGSSHPIRGEEFIHHVFQVAQIIKEENIFSPGDVVAVQMRTCYEWEVIDKAIQLNGGKILGLPFNLDQKRLKRFLVERKIQAIFTRDNTSSSLLVRSNKEPQSPRHLKIEMGEQPVDSEISGFCPQKSAVLVRTSGTTGTSKELEYNSTQVMMAMMSILERAKGIVGQDWRTISWLPLDHLTGRMVNYLCIYTGIQIHYLSNPREIIKKFFKVRPNFFMAVPIFYEKILEKATSNWLGRLSIQLANAPLCRWLIGKLLWNSKPLYLFSGSAPLSESLILAYRKLGLPIYELYGMSECAIPVSMSMPAQDKAGYVGQPLAGVELRRSKDGRLLIKSPALCNHLDTDKDGWFLTSDLVDIDSEGFVKVLGRCDDIYKTPTGKKVSLLEVEEYYRDLDGFSQFVVIGHPKAHTVGLVYLSSKLLHKFGKSLVLKESQGVTYCEDDSLERYIQNELDVKGENLPRELKVKNFIILSEPLSMENNEITDNLKLRRRFIESKYKRVIDEVFRHG